MFIPFSIYPKHNSSVCCHLFVVEGIEFSDDPEGYVSGNTSSWQGYPS